MLFLFSAAIGVEIHDFPGVFPEIGVNSAD